MIELRSYITIDGGTTNTRISLFANGKPTETVKLPIGSNFGAEHSEKYKSEIRKAIEKFSEADPYRIIASGMITSESGLYNLNHICAPAGIKELHNAMREVCLDDISGIPFVFIPGVKTVGRSFTETDMMRGEETEIFGLGDRAQSNCIFILPGSHSKLIETDTEGRISHFTTYMTGEMIAALSQHTILKSAVDLKHSALDENYLLEGYHASCRLGINAALFKARILKNLFSESIDAVYSYFLGTVLCGEINAVLESLSDRVVIGGKAEIKEAEALLLKRLSDKDVICVSDEAASTAPSVGAVRIFEYGGTKL